jgi:surfeit locus 1 family protein
VTSFRLVRVGHARAQGAAGYTRAGIIGTMIVLSVAIVCVRLGFWQLDRLEQRRGRNALVAQRMAAPAVDIDRIDQGDSAVYRRVVATGSCEGEPIILAARSRHGSPGVHLLCAFRTAGGRLVLLDRGWLPSADARTVQPARLAGAPRDTSIEALLVPFPPGEAVARSDSERTLEVESSGVELAEPDPPVIYRLNRAQASATLGMELPAWYAQLSGPTDRLPVPADPPDPGDGPHFGYAVQWFSFALIGLIGWLVLYRRRGHRSADPGMKQSG